jgi:hypothetical protein
LKAFWRWSSVRSFLAFRLVAISGLSTVRSLPSVCHPSCFFDFHEPFLPHHRYVLQDGGTANPTNNQGPYQ